MVACDSGRGDRATAVIPIELLAPTARAAALSAAVAATGTACGARSGTARTSAATRSSAATTAGISCGRSLPAIALLQWPWSARAMDEAGAALDVLSPAVVLTYAEAGGWGRALMLEARRRGIPSVGLQHGFIYRTG